MVIANCCAVLGYSSEANPISKAIKQSRATDKEPQDQPMQDSELDSPIPEDLANALKLFTQTHDIIPGYRP